MQVYGLPAALGSVFVLQAVLDNLELQLAYRADNLAVVELVYEQLRHTLVHQLVDALLQLLGLHGVGILNVLEHLWREGGQTAEMQLLALGEGVAYLEDAVVRQTYDVACPSLVDGLLALGHELCGTGETYRLAVADVQIGCIAHELARAYFAEGNAGTVVGVDVGGNLEDEAGELLLVGVHLTFLRHDGAWCGGYFAEAVQEFLHAEVGQCGTEEHGSQQGFLVLLLVEGGIYALDHLQVFTKFLGIGVAYPLVQFFALYVHLHLLCHLLLIGLEEVQVLLVDVVHTLEALTLVDGPRQGAHGNLQFLLQFVKQVERVASLTVHLVDEDDDGGLAHAAHLHQFACLGLHALGTVHHDDGAVHGSQCAEGVLGEILVAGGVQDVYLVGLVCGCALGSIFELHH